MRVNRGRAYNAPAGPTNHGGLSLTTLHLALFHITGSISNLDACAGAILPFSQMTSTSLDSKFAAGRRAQHEKDNLNLNDHARTEKLPSAPTDHSKDHEAAVPHAVEIEDPDLLKPHDNTHRTLKPRHIQLIGIGGWVDVSHYQVGFCFI
jgi:hypothetical protein